MNTVNQIEIKLTQFAHGAGCGCKISPQVLATILQDKATLPSQNLLVGNSSKDDAAVYKLNQTEALISTTDFFTPIVDDAFVFGKAAAANAISDVYAMGGTPFMALAILGWPVEKLPATLAQQVMQGAMETCQEAGVILAGGHTIDATEPFFGLSVNGKVFIQQLKQNSTAKEGNLLLLTKPLGIGILATAAKRGIIKADDLQLLHHQLVQLNNIGTALATVEGVAAMTDVTGFGFAGHLLEMAEGGHLTAMIEYNKLPILQPIKTYLQQRIVPDATFRNWNSYSQQIQFEPGVNVMEAFQILPDPQTNGGLLIAVEPHALAPVQEIFINHRLQNFVTPVGYFTSFNNKHIVVKP